MEFWSQSCKVLGLHYSPVYKTRALQKKNSDTDVKCTEPLKGHGDKTFLLLTWNLQVKTGNVVLFIPCLRKGVINMRTTSLISNISVPHSYWCWLVHCQACYHPVRRMCGCTPLPPLPPALSLAAAGLQTTSGFCLASPVPLTACQSFPEGVVMFGVTCW